MVNKDKIRSIGKIKCKFKMSGCMIYRISEEEMESMEKWKILWELKKGIGELFKWVIRMWRLEWRLRINKIYIRRDGRSWKGISFKWSIDR